MFFKNIYIYFFTCHQPTITNAICWTKCKVIQREIIIGLIKLKFNEKLATFVIKLLSALSNFYNSFSFYCLRPKLNLVIVFVCTALQYKTIHIFIPAISFYWGFHSVCNLWDIHLRPQSVYILGPIKISSWSGFVRLSVCWK